MNDQTSRAGREEKRKSAVGKFILDLFYKVTSRSFWAWLLTTAIVWMSLAYILQAKTTVYDSWVNTLLWIWGVISFLWIGGCVINDSLAKMIEKAALTINSNINANLLSGS